MVIYTHVFVVCLFPIPTLIPLPSLHPSPLLATSIGHLLLGHYFRLLQQCILTGTFSDIVSDHMEGDKGREYTCFSLDNWLLHEQVMPLFFRSSLRERRLRIGKII